MLKSSQKQGLKIKITFSAITIILATADLERSVGINTTSMFVPKVFAEIKGAPIDIPKHASMEIYADFK